MTTTHTPDTQKGRGKDANRDPITKTAGAHPVGTGIGAAAGGIAGGVGAAAATGAATGTLVGGPIGTAAGLVIGAVVGGMAGKAVAEKVDPTVEDAFWSDAHRKAPYYSRDSSYEDFAPAYRVGYLGHEQYPDKSFEDVESKLQANYADQRGRSMLAWDRAKDATRAAWNRVRGADSNHDTKLRH